jgi:hypothetical protein
MDLRPERVVLGACTGALLVALLACLPPTAAGAGTGNAPDEKAWVGAPAGDPQGAPGERAGGEDIATALPIASLPFSDYGSTLGRANDYDAVCPYTGSVAPDVVYSYEPAGDVNVTVSLCNSSYDTKVYVFQDGPGTVVACNDDAECGYNGWQSMLDHVDLEGGHTYYIVVDGYGASAGDYQISVVENAPCVLEVPPDAIVEREPTCEDGSADSWNGGCNSDPYAFDTVAPSDSTITLRGWSGTYTSSDVDYRDTDWYRLDVAQEDTITFCGTAEFPLLLWFLQKGPGEGCDDLVHLDHVTGTVCDEVCLTATVAPGEYWLWVGPSVYTGIPCGSGYVVTIDGFEAPSPVQVASWGTIKAMYR